MIQAFPNLALVTEVLRKKKWVLVPPWRPNESILTRRADQRVRVAAELLESGLGREGRWDRALEDTRDYRHSHAGLENSRPLLKQASSRSRGLCAPCSPLQTSGHDHPSPFLQGPPRSTFPDLTGTPEVTEAHYFPMWPPYLWLQLLPTRTQHLFKRLSSAFTQPRLQAYSATLILSLTNGHINSVLYKLFQGSDLSGLTVLRAEMHSTASA